MAWMEIDLIEQKIIEQRNFNNNSPLSENALNYILSKIELYIEEGSQISKSITEDYFLIQRLLELEALILNYIFTAIYTSETTKIEIKKNIVKDSQFAYQDYLSTISYYAEDFKDISFLANFYCKKIQYVNN